MTVDVRLGGAADVEAALDVWRRAHEARSGTVAEPGLLDVVRGRLLAAGSWFLVAMDDEVVVGMAAGMPARADDGAGPEVPGLCHLGMVFVNPGRWREGIGNRLVEEALTEARGRAYDRIQLWTHEDNQRAQGLYAARGFAPTGRTMVDDRGELIGHWMRGL